MKIGVKITLLIVSAIIGLVTLFLVSLSSLYELDDKFTYIGDSPMKNVELANELIDGINMSARQTAMICFDFDNITTRAKACHDAVEAVVRDLAALKSRPTIPTLLQRLVNSKSPLTISCASALVSLMPLANKIEKQPAKLEPANLLQPSTTHPMLH